MVFSILGLLSAQIAAGPNHTPNANNFHDYLTFIKPNADEQKFKEINWRNVFWPAVQEAKKLGRPILFWTMNGHPLGCT